MYATKIYLPSPQFERELFQCQNGKIKYYLKTGTKKERSINSKQIEQIDSLDILLNNIKSRIQDTIFHIPIQYISDDSINRAFLKTLNLITDSTIIINTSLYKRKIEQPFPSDGGDIYLPRIPARQIDGERMIFKLIMDQDTIIDLNVGFLEDYPNSKIHEIFFLSDLIKTHGFFQKVGIESYLSEEKLKFEIRKYIEALKK